MAAEQLTTYEDLVQHLLDYLGNATGGLDARDCRRAALNAYRELASAHRWAYYQALGHLSTVAPQTSSTVTYDHTGGTNEREVTLASGTWPSWAARGVLVLNSVPYQVAERKSSTVLTLNHNSNPGADVAAGTSYTLYQDTYVLPSDFLSMEELVMPASARQLAHIAPGDWIRCQRSWKGTAQPSGYAIVGAPDHYGALAAAFDPPPDAIYQVNYLYHRRPRPLVIEKYQTGTVTVSAGGTTVTGTSTAWSDRHVGCVLRFSADGTDYPTGPAGANPALYERVITAVASATSLTVDSAVTTALSAVKYVVSDPVDIEAGAMLTALLRCGEKQSTITRVMKNVVEAALAYREALILAREADSRAGSARGGGAQYYQVKDYPSGADIT